MYFGIFFYQELRVINMFFKEIKMELVIALVIFAAVAYYLFSKRREVDTEQEPAPYKVETPAPLEAPVVQATPEPVVESAPVVEAKPAAPAKAKRQPRQPAAKPADKPAAKKAPPVKKPAAIQAASKARKPKAK